jgi:hypothetical protein
MNVREIVTAHLKAGGFDGLAGEDCGCGLDDLMPCDGYGFDLCKPAKRHDFDGTCTVCAGVDGRVDDCYRVAEQPTNEEETHL